MTGEMSNPVDRDEWPLHAAVADHFRGDLRAFDVYQGPYILIDTKDGQQKVWVSPHTEHEDVLTVVHREAGFGLDAATSDPFDRHAPSALEDVIHAANEVVSEIPMTFVEALAVVQDLALQNALDDDMEDDPELGGQYAAQHEALELVATTLDHMNSRGVTDIVIGDDDE